MKKKIVMLGLPLLLIAGGAGAYATGQLDPLLGGEASAEAGEVAQAPAPAVETAFVEVKDLAISVIRDGIVYEVVYVDLALEVTPDTKRLVDYHRPHLRDRTQSGLRTLFSYRSSLGLPPIDSQEMKSVVLQVTRRMFGEEAVVDAHLISDWVTRPGI